MDVQAIGISVLGGHEDLATARLTIRQRLRGPTFRVARQFSAATDDDDRDVARQRLAQFRDARGDGGPAARRSITP